MEQKAGQDALRHAPHDRIIQPVGGELPALAPDVQPNRVVGLGVEKEVEGNPLRKDFVLASRVAKAWPGAVEPGESDEPGASRRAPMRPPGVPDPGTWGPDRS